ncbi:Uncharacterized protein pbN1_24720 [Aromatoleum bremense]|nr:Uncharacterized protein pbN1_24720 [Aromatoleum bremense]
MRHARASVEFSSTCSARLRPEPARTSTASAPREAWNGKHSGAGVWGPMNYSWGNFNRPPCGP